MIGGDNTILFPQVKSESDIKNLESSKKEQELKYHGLTIKRNTVGGLWSTRYRLNGKQYYISAKTQSELLKKLKEALNIKENQKNKTFTFIHWYNEWINLYKKNYVRSGTIVSYNSSINNLSECFKNKELIKITGDDIAKELILINRVRAKQKAYETLKLIFDQAVKTDKIEKNPIRAIQKPKYTRERGVALNNEECKLFIKKCLEHNCPILIFILYQGFRIGEALALQGEDIDLENNLININKSFNQKNEFDITKNKQSVRIVPLFDNSKQLIKNISLVPQNRIFKYTQKSLNKIFNIIINECNFESTLRISDLRHTFISKCQTLNIPEHIIQSWVGHNIGSKVTRTTYTHLTSDANLLYINKLNSEI